MTCGNPPLIKLSNQIMTRGSIQALKIQPTKCYHVINFLSPPQTINPSPNQPPITAATMEPSPMPAPCQINIAIATAPPRVFRNNSITFVLRHHQQSIEIVQWIPPRSSNATREITSSHFLYATHEALDHANTTTRTHEQICNFSIPAPSLTLTTYTLEPP